MSKEASSFAFPILPSSMAASSALALSSTAIKSCTFEAPASRPNNSNQMAYEAYKPKAQRFPIKGVTITSTSAAKIRCPGTPTAMKDAIAIDIAQENQPIKQQDLDGGRSRQKQAQFKSTAEMVKKFQSRTTDTSFSQNKSAPQVMDSFDLMLLIYI